MNCIIKRKNILFFLICFIVVISFSKIVLAKSATSQAGIYFTEQEIDTNETSQLESNELPDTNSGGESIYLPQTGEKDQHKLLIIALIVITLSLLIRIKVKKGELKMKLNRIIAGALISGGILFGMGNVVLAATQDEIKGSEDGKSGTSHGYIKLTPGDTSTGPTEPTKPTEPSGETGNEGSLTIDNIAPLLFDTHKLEGKEQVYTSTVVDSNVQVTDKRGEEEGWTLQISQTPFKDVEDDTKVLKGTKLILPLGVLETVGVNVSKAPVANSVEVTESPSILMSATAGSGAGTWVNTFDKDEIKLTIPAGNKNGEYMSTVTWSLTDAPN